MSNSKQHLLHLPKTDFPMKARLFEKEPKLIEFWNKNRIYQKLISQKKGQPLFHFVDGPPYANGPLHIGHALNKILKDIVVKYQNLSGNCCPFTPVWDCHGLPIELSALKKIKKQNKQNLSPQQIREHCRKEALSWIQVQKKEFQQLGVLADWENPLLTMDPDYEVEEIRGLAQIVQKQLIYRGQKPVYWCAALQTAIASSEAEYREHKSPSIYVRFRLLDAPKKWNLEKSKACSLVIWTTTPWTLPANQAVCLKKDLLYTVFLAEPNTEPNTEPSKNTEPKAETNEPSNKTTLNKEAKLTPQNTEYLILIDKLKKNFEQKTGLKLKKVLSFKGAELEHKKASHPFIDKNSLVVLGDHVSAEEGTGCVHTAPGHGAEDFLVGKKYNLPIFVPVDKRGCFTSEVPEWEGLNVFKANPLIIEKLKTKKALIKEQEITHSYPYNPRSKSPLIFRATDQWFIAFDNPNYSVREKALSEIEHNIQFHPDWGKQRLKAMIQTSPDWCLSRQRKWGVPIPVFYCQACEHALLNTEVIEHVAHNMEKSGQGIEYWFSNSAKNLLPKGVTCPKCKAEEFKKGQDILDVWFDSGICHQVFYKKYGASTFPADIYLEGSDQHRGWFQTSLNSSICLKGKAPFKNLITHCFVNDATGHKMSKSRGNTLNLQNVIQQKGAEILRLWIVSEDYSQDLQVSQESLARVTETYRRLRNSIRFMLGNLFDFEPERDFVPFQNMQVIDQWILGRLSYFIQKTAKNYESFLFHKIYQDLNSFFTVDLSSLYLDILKDRLYTFKKEGQKRRSAQTGIWLLLKNLLPAISPMASFLSEEAYQNLPGKKEESVFLTPFPTPSKKWEQKALEQKFEHFLQIRQKAYAQIELLRNQKVIGSSLGAQVAVYVPPSMWEEFKGSEEVLREFLIVSCVELKKATEGEALISVRAEKAKGNKCDRCWNFSESLDSQNLCPKCLKNLA